MDYQAFTFELPTRADDAPLPSTEKVRHLALPDGEHWVKVKGGGTQREAMYIEHANRLLKPKYDSVDEEQAALYAYNRALATFLADRIVEHNLTYPGSDEPLPLGMALFFELPGREALNLVYFIQRPPSFFADPKAGTPSSGG